MRRQLVTTIERRKEMMIAALWANSGFEGEDGAKARRSAIEDLEEHYDEAVQRIINKETDEEVETEDKYGFFAAGSRGVKKLDKPVNVNGSVAQAINPEHVGTTDQG